MNKLDPTAPSSYDDIISVDIQVDKLRAIKAIRTFSEVIFGTPASLKACKAMLDDMLAVRRDMETVRQVENLIERYRLPSGCVNHIGLVKALAERGVRVYTDEV